MPTDRSPPSRPPLRCIIAALCAAAALSGCNTPSKEALEAAKNTFACELNGERLVIRFDTGEARMLMPPNAERVTLYQIASASGVRFTNGVMELRGKGMELQLIRDGTLIPLVNCQPYPVPQ